MRADSARWTEVTASQFTHEAEGLSLVRQALPDVAPFRAWSNFEFRDAHGKWHEVDLLVLGRGRLHLVELKYYSGVLRGDDHRWLRAGHRAEDSPLKLAHRKAQRLASKLRDELQRWARETDHRVPDPHTIVPYVQEAVFLHHPDLSCELPPASRIDLFGLDGANRRGGLPGITDRLLESAHPAKSSAEPRDLVIAKLMAMIGVQRRQREVGSWIIEDEPLTEGDGWQDWPAFHKVAERGRARIRFFVTRPGSSAAEQARVQRLVEHEFTIMSRLSHDGVLRPQDLVDDELGVGLVYPFDERFQRLDLWLAERAGGIPAATQVAILRQVAEAVAYAHSHGVVHRGLTPMAVLVRETGRGEPRVLVTDWQTAGRAGSSTSGAATATVLGQEDTGAAERLAALVQGRRPDASGLAEVFRAPEGLWARNADRVRLDIFALGALAYYLFTGRPPASDGASLRERLGHDDGLDPAAELSQVRSAVRALVLEATRPKVGQRLADAAGFLRLLADAEQALAGPAEAASVDPLEATAGEVLDGRWELVRRLGAGSTAVALLVRDLTNPDPRSQRVLKVALDDAAAGRLDGEASVLRGLRHPRLVRLIDGPIAVGGRRAFVLEYAGEQTLGEVLRERPRLSIDLLERWGRDLLEALVALDHAGLDHRDVKPANLGVLEGRGDHAKHLVLFDFSLARAGASAVSAGTTGYLDPFVQSRGRYDSAAERYAATVVLFEMATGQAPVYGDPDSHPAAVPDDATVTTGMFDDAVAAPLVAFFTTALARDSTARFHTAGDMLAAWRAAFAPVPRTVPNDAQTRIESAGPGTVLTDSGLSARALSALEPLGVATVGDVVTIDPVRLNHFPGAADATRREVKQVAKRWRDRLGTQVTGRRPAAPEAVGTLPDPLVAAQLLVGSAGGVRAEARRRAARLLLGLDAGMDAFAAQADIGKALEVSRARGAQYVDQLQQAWSEDDSARDLLDAFGALSLSTLRDLGGVATVDELAGALLSSLPSPTDDAQHSVDLPRLGAGLLRLALDRAGALKRAEGEVIALAQRRRSGRIALLATTPGLLDAAEALSRRADELVIAAQEAGEPVVPAARVVRELGAVLDRSGAPVAVPSTRLPRLAAALSRTATASSAGELHSRALPLAQALRLALAGQNVTQQLPAKELRDRARARFPALPALPDRPRLDAIVAEADLGLHYDEPARVYRTPTIATRWVYGHALEPDIESSAEPLTLTEVRHVHRSPRPRSGTLRATPPQMTPRDPLVSGGTTFVPSPVG